MESEEDARSAVRHFHDTKMSRFPNAFSRDILLNVWYSFDGPSLIVEPLPSVRKGSRLQRGQTVWIKGRGYLSYEGKDLGEIEEAIYGAGN